MLLRYALLFVFVLVFSQVPQASAIDIVTVFVGGDAPQNSAGAGNLPEIFNAAAARWASAYPDTFTLTLYYGWASTGSAGTHVLIEQAGDPEREIAGLILFDNSGAVPFYLDPTPSLDEEYRKVHSNHPRKGSLSLARRARAFPEPAAEILTAQSSVRPPVAKLCAACRHILQPGEGSASALTATPSNLFCVPTTLRR
jgi:hypothetical protein